MSCETTSKKDTSINLVIGNELYENKNGSSAWFAYGLSLIAWEVELDKNNKPDLLKREIFARSSAAQVWEELREKQSVTEDPALDALVLIHNSGFMHEYVSIYIFHDSKTDLNSASIDKFTEWMAQNLPGHKAVINPGVSVQ